MKLNVFVIVLISLLAVFISGCTDDNSDNGTEVMSDEAENETCNNHY